MRVPNNHDKRMMRIEYTSDMASPAAALVLLLSDLRAHHTTMRQVGPWRCLQYWLLGPLCYFHRPPRLRHLHDGNGGDEDAQIWMYARIR